MTIKFIGNEIGDRAYIDFAEFATSFEFMTAVVNGYYHERTIIGTSFRKELESGDRLFDYETGTMWEVVE